MTPHERAKQVVINYWPGRVTDEHLADGIASAIEAHTADLRTLLAQQAARADALEKSVDRYNELAGRDADRLAELRSALDAETTRRQGLERRIEELLAREARLREALTKSREMAVAAANADVDAAVSLEPGSDVFGAAGIAKKALVVEAKRRWAQYDNCIDAALAGGDHE